MPADQADPPGDGELWGRGDQASFSVLFERHAQAVWNHAYRLTGSWASAEDLTSATFLTAWRKRSDFDLRHGSARPWLYTVAGNLARDEHRGATRRSRLLRRVSEPPVVSDHADSVVDQLHGEVRLRKVIDAVRRLSKSQQVVVELCLLAELPTADAAAHLGIAEVTVRSQLSRARARLRTMLEENE
jgi:RNA polymerase sigma factor (sigma-70 family)